MNRIERAPGFFKKEFRLLRILGFDNRQAVRVWLPPDETIVTWCWGLRVSDLPKFHNAYSDARRQIVRPQRNARVWAMSWKVLDNYVCGYDDVAPVAVPFDSALHLGYLTRRQGYCWCGCGMPDGEFDWFENPFGLCFAGPAVYRRTHAPRERV